MPNGLIHPNDEKAALDLAAALKEAFAENLVKNAKAEASDTRGNSREFGATNAIDEKNDTYWTTDDEVKTASLTIDFGNPTTFNRLLAQEYIRLGQRVKAFTIEAEVNGNWQELAKATTIGYKRILRFPTVTATKLRFNITDSKACPVISNVGVYNAPQILTSPTIIRNQRGEISIIPADAESIIYYTLDGSEATKESEKYNGPVQTEGKVKISAISHEPSSGKSSSATTEEFGLPRKDWKIVGIEDEKANRILDGNLATAWRHGDETKLPVDLVIDLGAALTLSGFKYYPEQNSWQPSTITHYEFFISADGKNWKKASEGEFANIKNNPLWQTKQFEAVPARFIKLRALKNTENNTRSGYAEIDVITD
jgi:alpha-L-fucosidase